MIKKSGLKGLNLGKFIFPAVLLAVVAVFLKRVPSLSAEIGQAVEVQSREHIKVGAGHPAYNSDPPTSGWHYAATVAAGVYDTPYPDESLTHSLEHGYVIVSYNCRVKDQGENMRYQKDSGRPAELFGVVRAHEGEPEASPSSESSPSAAPSDDASCRHLKSDLNALARKLKVWKLIILPRVGLSTRLALTAWGRIDKFNSESTGLTKIEEERIKRFVERYRDRGPEKTAD